MTAEWSSPTAWWAQLLERDRTPVPGGAGVGRDVHAGHAHTTRVRMWAIEQDDQVQIIVRDASDLIQVRREAQRLAQSLDAARGEAAAAAKRACRRFGRAAITSARRSRI